MGFGHHAVGAVAIGCLNLYVAAFAQDNHITAAQRLLFAGNQYLQMAIGILNHVHQVERGSVFAADFGGRQNVQRTGFGIKVSQLEAFGIGTGYGTDKYQATISQCGRIRVAVFAVSQLFQLIAASGDTVEYGVGVFIAAVWARRCKYDVAVHCINRACVVSGFCCVVIFDQTGNGAGCEVVLVDVPAAVSGTR